MFPPPSLGPELQGKSSSQLLLWERPSVRPEMKEEPRTGLDLFKFFCVGFGKGGHVNFIGVGQDLGLKMPVCLVLAVPLVRRSALAQGMRGSRRMGGGGGAASRVATAPEDSAFAVYPILGTQKGCRLDVFNKLSFIWIEQNHLNKLHVFQRKKK